MPVCKSSLRIVRFVHALQSPEAEKKGAKKPAGFFIISKLALGQGWCFSSIENVASGAKRL